MKASDIMSRNVAVVMENSSLQDAARLMLERRVSGLPVVDNRGVVKGMITEGDIMRRVETGTARHASWLATFLSAGRTAQDYVRSHGRKVAELMDGEVVSVGSETPLEEIVALMESRHIKRVPVIDNGHLVGIVARADLVKALLMSGASSGDAPAVADARIRTQFLEEVDGQPWGPRGAVDCTVKDGVIELRGIITDDRLRPALRVLAENIHGARGIRDHIICIEPVSAAVVSEGSDSVLPAA